MSKMMLIVVLSNGVEHNSEAIVIVLASKDNGEEFEGAVCDEVNAV